MKGVPWEVIPGHPERELKSRVYIEDIKVGADIPGTVEEPDGENITEEKYEIRERERAGAKLGQRPLLLYSFLFSIEYFCNMPCS